MNLMECPVCGEGFDDTEKTPYVLCCGHSLCKDCVVEMQWAVIRLPLLAVQLPLLIACPWCQSLTLRVTWKGSLKYPRKNFFLLGMVESLKGNSVRQRCNADTVFVHPATECCSVPAIVRKVRLRPKPAEALHRAIENPPVLQVWAASSLGYLIHFAAKCWCFPSTKRCPEAVYALVTILFVVLSFLLVCSYLIAVSK